jgi:rhomboid family GlyGly-CTERM serine protease
VAQQEGLSWRVPLLTLALVAASLLAYAVPGWGERLLYDRQAILAGQWWRLVSAPLGHFSASHLGWNLLVFGAAGWAVESAGYRYFWLVCALAAVLPGVCYLLWVPRLAVYGGLSGLATGAVAYRCFGGLRDRERACVLWRLILALVVAKIALEAVWTEPLFARAAERPFRALPLVHGVGLAAAALATFWPGRGAAGAGLRRGRRAGRSEQGRPVRTTED